MALLKFIGGIRLGAALVKCGITLVVALLELTAGIILRAKKVAIRAWEAHSDSGRTSMMYLHGRRVVREVWLPRATNIQAAYVDYGPIFVLFSHLFPMRGQQTDRPGHSLLCCHAFLPFFTLFQPRDTRLIP